MPGATPVATPRNSGFVVGSAREGGGSRRVRPGDKS